MKKLAIIVPVAITLALLGARLLLPSARAAQEVERRLEARLGTDVSFGPSRYSGFSSLRIDDVVIHFSSGADMTAGRLTINAGFLPLFRGQVSSGAFRLEKLGLGWNGTRAEGRMEGSFDAALGKLAVDAFDVTSGDARLTGSAESGKVVVRWVNLDPSSFTALVKVPAGLLILGPTAGEMTVAKSTGGYRAKVRADLTASAIEWKSVATKSTGTALTLSVALARDGDTLTLRDLVVDLASIRISGEGDVIGAGETERLASLRLRTGDFDITDLFRHLKMAPSDALSLSGPASATLTVDGGTSGGRFVADIDGTRLDATYHGTFHKDAGVRLRALTEGRYATPLAIDLSTVRLEIGGVEMNGRGSYTPGKVRPTYTFRMKSNVFRMEDAAALTPMIRPFTPTGQGVLSMRIIRGESGPAMSGALTLLETGADIGGGKLTGLSGTVPFTDDAVSARSLTGRLDGAPLRADVSAHRYAGRAFIEADLRLDELNIGNIASRPVALSSAPFDTAGVLRAGHIEHPAFSADDATVEWNLTGVSAGTETVTGTLSWRQGPGRLGDLSPLMSVSPSARALLLPLAVMQKGEYGFGDLTFEAIDADVTLSSGTATLQSFLLQGVDRDLGLKGTFPTGGTGTVAFSARLRAGDKSGVLRLRVDGDADAPRFSSNPQ